MGKIDDLTGKKFCVLRFVDMILVFAFASLSLIGYLAGSVNVGLTFMGLTCIAGLLYEGTFHNGSTSQDTSITPP